MNDKNNVLNTILRKVKVIYIVFGVACIAIFVRIIWIQLGGKGEQLRTQAIEYSFRNDVIEATRGNILSEDGRILATSIPYYEIRMDMVAKGLDSAYFYQNVRALSDSLSSFFGDKSSAEYHKALTEAKRKRNAYFRVNFKKVNYLELQKLKTFPIFSLGANKGGFLPVEMGRRVQPYGKLASRSIGFVNRDGLRVGIEGGFEDYLRGKDGLSMMQKISGRFWIPVASPNNVDPVNGMDVVTTINIELQDFAQASLAQQLTFHEADWGTIMVMETKTGHIKAIANATRSSTGDIVENYNYAIGMSQEPGSTFKLATLLALLDDGKADINEMYETGGGRAIIGPVTVVDATRVGYGTLSLQGVFEKSSNIGFAKAINKYYGTNPAKFIEALTRLGLHKELGLQIAGEARPVLKHPKLRNNWDGMTLTMMSYGYAVRITPIQTLTLYNAVANNGVMVKPLFVKNMIQYGDTVATYQSEVINPKICSDKTLATVQACMEGVVVNGTAKMVANKDYRVGAKTGTAQIAMGSKGYRDNGGRHYLASIAGYFPADNPKYTMVVIIKTFHRDGSKNAYYGGALSGPLFKMVADYIFNSNYELVKPLVSVPVEADKHLSAKGEDMKSVANIYKALKVTGGETTKSTMDTVTNRTANNVIGMTLNEALSKLERAGFSGVTTQGRGVVVSQGYDTTTNKIVLILN